MDQISAASTDSLRTLYKVKRKYVQANPQFHEDHYEIFFNKTDAERAVRGNFRAVEEFDVVKIDRQLYTIEPFDERVHEDWDDYVLQESRNEDTIRQRIMQQVNMEAIIDSIVGQKVKSARLLVNAYRHNLRVVEVNGRAAPVADKEEKASRVNVAVQININDIDMANGSMQIRKGVLDNATVTKVIGRY